jgi:hypothetical protein
MVVVAVVAAGVALPLFLSHTPARASISGDLYVSPSGNDKAIGTTSSQPLKTIQAALNEAAPGATIHLAPGSYHQHPVTRNSGTESRPITVEGTDTTAAVGHTVLWGKGRIFTINDSYYRLQGFTIDGEHAVPASSYPTALTAAAPFKLKLQSTIVDSTLIFIGASGPKTGVTGVVIDQMNLVHAGGDCVRLRANANHDTIENSTIAWCGMHGKYAGQQEYEFHNGEGVYVGTSPKSTDQPSHSDDTTSYIVVTHNDIHTYGSECFDVKENSHNNSFVDNDCGENTEPLADSGSNIELRGYDNTVIGNHISGSLGFGLKMASDSANFPQGGNIAENNTFASDLGAPILNRDTKPQGLFCGNTFATNTILDGTSVGAPTKACTS